MKRWVFEIDGSPKDVLQRLDPVTLSKKGFLFRYSKKVDGTILFKLRKIIKDFDKLYYYNLIVLKGEIVSQNDKSSSVIIHFKEHYLNIILRIVLLILGLLAMATGLYVNSGIFIIGVIFFLVGVLLYLWMNSRFKVNIKKYKLFLIDLLGIDEE